MDKPIYTSITCPYCVFTYSLIVDKYLKMTGKKSIPRKLKIKCDACKNEFLFKPYKKNRPREERLDKV